MKNVVLIIKNTIQFILSLFTNLKNSFFKKKEYAIIPASKLSIQTKTIRWKSISIHRNVRLLLIMLVLSGWSYGQSIFTNTITGTSINANPYATGQTLNANITSTGIGRGTGTAQVAANDRYNVSGVNSTTQANAITANDYFEFSITPNSCFEIDFTNLVYTSQISTGSINLALRSSVDAYAANIGTSTSTTGATFSLTGASLQNINANIKFRLYAWGASAGGTTFSINDFTFNGAVVSLGGTLSGGATVCTGTNSTTLTLSGQTGSITKWQSSTSSTFASAVTDISNTTTSLTATNLTTTTYYRAVVSGVPCYSSTATITVSPASVGGSVAGSTTVCTGTNSTLLTLSGHTGAITRWESSLNNFSTAGTAIANTTTTLTATNLTATTSYRAVLTSGACVSANSVSATVTVTPTNTSGAASSSPSLCTNTTLTNITHTTTDATSIGTATGLPTGVSAAWASNVITISGTPTAAGTFSYTIPLNGGCGAVNATGTITVTDGIIGWSNLQSPASQTVCLDNNATIYGRIYKAGFTEAAGANAAIVAQIGYNSTNTNPSTWAAGNWSAATYNVQSGNNDEYSANLGAALSSGTYYYAFRYSLNGCTWYYGGYNAGGGGFWDGSSNVNGVLTVSPNNTVAAASSTPTLCINTALTNITHATTGATGIGSATGLPAGVAASWNSNTITIYGTPSAAGTFTYSIPLIGGCGSVNATGTITVSPANTISLTSAVGTNAQLKCINSAITNITYSTTGAIGASFSGLPAGVSGNWASNVVTISGTPTAYGVYNYTVTLTGGCGSVTANGSINVNGLDYGNLQFPGTQTICIGNNFTAYGQVFEPGITEPAGANVNIDAQFGYHTSNTDPSTWPAGNWSATTYSIQSGNNDEYRIDFGSALTTGTYYYTFRYRINGCSWQYGGAFSGFWNGTTQPSGVLTVSPNNTVGLPSSTPTVCINTALTNITHTTTGATGILNAGTIGANGLPAGVAASWNTNTITIFGTPSTAGTFNYSIPLVGGCGAVNATGTITVSPASVGGTIAGSASVCSGTNSTVLTLSGHTGAITRWESSLNNFSTAGTAIANTTITLTATNLTATTSYRAVLTSGVCAAANSASAIVTVSPNNTAGTASSTPTLCANTALTSITHTTTGATGILNAGTAGVNGLPAGVAASWNSNTITIFGTPSAAGTFNYSIPLTGGCGSVNATGTIIVNPPAPAQPGSIVGLTSFCNGQTGNTFSISPVTNATTYNWTAPSGWVLTAGSGTNAATFTTGSASGNISVSAQNSCGTSAVRNLAVTVLSNMVASAASISPTICSGASIGTITHTTSSATSISNDGVSGANGLPAGVSASWASNTISISGISNVPGTYNYSISLLGGCGTANATGTIIITPTNTAGVASSTPTVCINTALTNITHATTGATGISNAGTAGANGLPAGVAASWNSNSITIFGTPSVAGTFNYSIPLTGGCGAISATGTITVSPASVGGTIAGSASVCTGTNSTTLTLSGHTGAITRWESSLNNFSTAGTTIANTTTTFTATNLTATTSYRAVLTSGVCAAANSATATVTVNPKPVIANKTATICSGQAFSVTPVNGTDIVPAGTTYTWTVVINANVTGETNQAVAQTIISQTLTNTTNTVQNVVYTVTPTSPTGSCVGSTFTVTVSVNPTAVIANKTATICSGGTFNISPTNGGAEIVPAGSVYSWTVVANANLTGEASGSDLSTISGTLNNLSNSNQTIVYTVVPTSGLCDGASFTVSVTVTPTSVGGSISGSASVCTGTNSTLLTLSGHTGAVTRWESSLNNFSTAGTAIANTTTTLTATNLTATTSYRAVITSGSCAAANSTSATVTVSPATVGGTLAGSATVCTGTNSTTLTLSGHTGSIVKWQSSPVINFGAPITDIANTTTSLTATNLSVTTYYRAVIQSGNCTSLSSATAIVTVTPNNTATLSSAAGTNAQTKCINTAITNITYATTTATGATFSGLPAGVNGNWAANVATISGTPTASGTFNYTVTLTGGCGAVTATGSIVVTPANTIALTSAVGTNAQTVCRNTAITNITYSTTGATGATFSGLPAGVSGVWAANVVTISGTTTTAATYNYTVTLTGGCGVVTATGSVIVNALSVGGTIAGSTSKCAGTNSSGLTLSGHTGSVIRWESSTSSTFASAVTSIANTSTTLTATNLSVTTYYRAVVQNGVCGSINSAIATITITQAGSGNFSYSSYGFCTSTSTAQAISTSNFTGVAGTFSSTAGLSIVGATGSILPSASTAGAYVVTYTIPATGGCAAYTTTTNVTIDGQGTGTISYSPSTICTGTAGTVSPIITGAGGSGASTWFTAAPGTINMDANGVITPSTSSEGTYTITYNRSSTGLCATYSTTTSVTINASPTITSSTPGSRCGTGSVVLGGISSTGTVNWFDVLTGGTSLASGNTFNTPSISANTTYYADAVSVNGCVAGARTPVLATVFAIPTISTTTPASRCGTGTLTLSASASAGTLNWYDVLTGGTSLGTGGSYVTPSISSTTNYFVETISNGCSSARSTVAATIIAIPTVASTTPASNCGSGSVTLGATSTGTLNWYAASTGGASLATGTSYTTPIISTSTTYFVDASANGCTSARTAVIAGIATSPSISSFINGSRCNTGTVNLSATPSSGATIKWYSAATGGSLLATGNSFTTPSLSTSTTYYAEATAGSCIQPSRTAVTATINITPVVSITADYCTVPGNVVLTANAGMSSYTWSNGGNTQSINVDQAGNYNVIIVSAGGCFASGSVPVATELVTNGSFTAGNTGFTTSYTFVADGAGQAEMYPEGTYAVVSNPNTVHDQFYGQDRNSATGKILVINGSPTLLTVWNQNNISVQPNTTYYFSGWGMSVYNGQNAILQFSINGSQVGTIAYLPNGYTNNAGPYTWVRFYGQWESGPLTTANLSIVNLNTVAGGNDFALDDISFGTMSPVALSANPIISGNAVCQNEPLTLTAGAIGGASPFTYSWTGPNGFTSTLENPLVTSTASSTQNGTYTVQVTDGFGCTSTQNIAITVSSAPTNIVISAAASAVCSGGSTNINLPSSETGVYYQLRNNATNASIGALVQGTGAALSLPTGVLTATTTFNVLATRYPANCDVQMGNTVTVSLSVTPEIAITNQAACSGTVNLTAAGVTAGSTGSGTLTYWTTLAATTAVTTPTAVGSGTYFIKSTNGTCFDIEPVVVSISATPSAAFTYASASYCTTGADPIATVTGTAGVFTSTPAGLVFVNTNNGEIDLSASTPGTYTVRNTVTPTGACSAVNTTQSVIITAAPLAGFNYVSNDLCQSANALNAAPIFDAGASAGTFSTSAGLSLNTSTGIIDVSASTPGNYAVVNTRGASGGCPAFSDTTFLDINPYIFTGSVSSSSSDDVICLNETVNLYSNATTYATVLLRERFNGSINNWFTTNSSSGGTPANADWRLRQSPFNYNGNNHTSNDASQFYMSNAQAQGTGTTNTLLRSPVMSTIGFSSLSMDFFHYFNYNTAGDIAKVQISTNNTTWTDLGSFTSDQGSRTGFVNQSYNLNAYIGLPTVYIRFTYTASGSNSRTWCIDNVSVTGNSINYDYAWSSSPAGFSQTIQNPVNVTPLVNTYYTVTATNRFGCSTPTSPIPVTVNPLPADNAGLDQNICGSGSVTLGAATTVGNTYAWTPAATLSSSTVAQPVASPVANTTYTLTETITATGCSISNDVVVTVTPLPTIVSTAPAGRCGTGTVTLSAVSSTGTMKWYANLTGGVALGTANSFTTPSISANTTYYVEATSATCVATSRVAVIATINAAPSISSQATAAASYSQNITANALSLVATAGSGTITGYQWYSNTSASTVGATELSGATSDSYVPSTATVGTLYYYCVVTNSNGCTVNSAFSGAIITLVTPAVTSVTGTTPSISGQVSSTGYRGQAVTINGTNFASNSTVTINGVAATVTFVNSTQLRAVVNNTGINSTGNMVVTNPTTGAFVNSPFSYIGYLTSGTSTDWSTSAAWLGNTTPTVGSNATLAHANTCNSAVTASMNQVTVIAGASLNFGSVNSSLTTSDLINNGTITWTNTGTLTIGNTIMFSGAAVFNAGNGTVVFNKSGDQVLFSGQSMITFNNVSIVGSGNKSLGLNTDIVVKNLIINSGTTFNLSTSDSEVLVKGDLTVDGNIAAGTSNFQFIGTTPQQISVLGSGTAVFSSMKVNKASGLLLMNDNVQVQDSLIMIQGNIDTQGFLLEIGKDLTQRGTIAYTSGMIQGKLRRWYAASINTGNESGLFPMGQDVSGSWKNRHVLLEYSVAPTTGGHLTVEFMAIPMINGSLGTQNFISSANTGGAGFQVSNFSNDGYWKIDNLASTLIDGSYSIALSGEGFSLPNGLNELTIVKRVGGGDWFCPGTHLAPTGTAGLPTLRRSGVSGFSNFGFAGGPSNPLPITLVNFDGICDGSKVNLSWTTASESNNKMFVIEVSNDAKSWSTVETVLGAGNSNSLRNYSLAVNSSYSNGSYYRLTQVDFNGDSETFDPIYVNCDKQISNEVSIYPNPAYEVSNLDIKATEDMDIQLTVFSSTGQILMSQKTTLKKGNNLITLDLSNLTPGMYHVNIINDKKIEFSGSRSFIKR